MHNPDGKDQTPPQVMSALEDLVDEIDSLSELVLALALSGRVDAASTEQSDESWH